MNSEVLYTIEKDRPKDLIEGEPKKGNGIKR